METPATLPNRAFRRALLSLNGLARPLNDDPLPVPRSTASAEWVDGMVKRLGFVQVDAVSAVERAQHHILFSRNHRYTQSWLEHRLEDARTLFEGWTHDAAILPSEFFPYWRHYFDRFKKYEVHGGYKRYFDGASEEDVARVLRRVRRDGALKPRDFDPTKAQYDWAGADPATAGFTAPTVAKVALEYLWRTGKLAVARRDGREKVYDLAQRVLPDEHYRRRVKRSEYVDWSCRQALRRLGVATPAQIARFFFAVSTEEATRWCRRALGGDLVEARVEHADGSVAGTPTYALADQIESMVQAPAAPTRLRLINPFDPLIHDRQRTARVFGFEYALEIFVPAKKRKYGYYVLPILEGERFTGRIDVKADRKAGVLRAIALYWEDGVAVTRRRRDQLERELKRLSGFCQTRQVVLERATRRALR